MLESPDLPELIEQAQHALANERKLREKFYADITPERKWEFIQGEVIMHSPALNGHLLATTTSRTSCSLARPSSASSVLTR